MNNDTVHYPSDDPYNVDFVMTIITSFVGCLVIFCLNTVPGHYGPHIGVILTFMVLFYFGYHFAMMPVRFFGHILMVATSLFVFLGMIKFRFNADWLVALLATCVSVIPTFWGFLEGMKKLNEENRQKLDNSIIGMIKNVAGVPFLSVASALILCGATRIPYAGLFVGSALAFGLGWCLGRMKLPFRKRFIVATLSLAGFFFGLKWQLDSSSSKEVLVVVITCIGTCIGTGALLYGIMKGICRSGNEASKRSLS